MKRRPKESGFALLLVFVMAAAIAIALYVEVPRIAFESQRAREQMAIDRGLQYKRAIQLFYRKYQTFPQTLDDLETSRNIRFLRHRYQDPLTGKEWRLLHVGPSGQLTDSLIQPPAPLPGSSTGSGQNLTGASQAFGSSQSAPPAQSSNTATSQPVDPNNPNAQAPDPLNMALRRPSDRIQRGGGAGAPGAEPVAEDPPQEPADPNQPQQQPGQPGQEPADPNQPPTPQDPTQNQNAGLPPVPGQPPIPGQQPFPGQPGNPQDPSSGAPTGAPTQQPNQGANPAQTPGFQPFNSGQQTGQPGQAGVVGASATNQSASNLIQQILTTPRQSPSSNGFSSANTGGIAGVASTAEGKGIHVINDHNKYKEWEFYYDLKKDKSVVGAAAVNGQQQVQQQMQQNGGNNPLGSSPFSSSSGGFNSPGGNSSSPFSSTPTNSPNSGAPAAPSTPPPSQ
jgi:type II secretory pathway pseudopilin PulG